VEEHVGAGGPFGQVPATGGGAEIDLDGVWGEVGPFIGIARGKLQDALVAGARPVPCRLGTSITTIDEDDRQASVRFTDGSTGDYDLVVGADGIRSTVRELVFGGVEPTFAGQVAWRSVAPIVLPGSPSVQFWLGEGCFFGLCSVGDSRTYGFGYATHDVGHDPIEGRLGRLRERFAAMRMWTFPIRHATTPLSGRSLGGRGT